MHQLETEAHNLNVVAREPERVAASSWGRHPKTFTLPDLSRCSELSKLYSITSSARASRVGGISSPRALAVLRLMTSSYLVGACTGRSAGFSPLRMRST